MLAWCVVTVVVAVGCCDVSFSPAIPSLRGGMKKLLHARILARACMPYHFFSVQFLIIVLTMTPEGRVRLPKGRGAVLVPRLSNVSGWD